MGTRLQLLRISCIHLFNGIAHLTIAPPSILEFIMMYVFMVKLFRKFNVYQKIFSSTIDMRCPSLPNTIYTTQCRHNAFNYLQNPHDRPRPQGRAMGCLLWVQNLLAITLLECSFQLQHIVSISVYIFELPYVFINFMYKYIPYRLHMVWCGYMISCKQSIWYINEYSSRLFLW